MANRVVERLLQSRMLAESDHITLSDCDLLKQFVKSNDQAAFATLVSRHSAMVFGVCRRILHSQQDAEDACQAVFVVLSSKAKSRRWRDSITNWLFITARNVANNVRLAQLRRRKREGIVARSETSLSTDAMTSRELIELLDEELAKLAPHYRDALVLCYLEGLTRDEAALRLSIPESTLKSHLERARKKLAKALSVRGCTLGTALLATAATSIGSSPPELSRAIMAAVGGSPSASVAEYAKGAAFRGTITKPKLALLAFASALAIGMVVGGVMPDGGQTISVSKAAAPQAPGLKAESEPAQVPVLKAESEPTSRLDQFGDVLPDGVLARLGTIRSRASISSYGFASDGTVVTVGPNFEVRTWNSKSDRSDAPIAIPPLEDRPDRLYPQISLDGRFIAAASRSKAVVWERQPSGFKEVAKFEIKDIAGLTISPNGSKLAVAYQAPRTNYQIALCDVATGAVQQLNPQGFQLLHFSGDGRRLLAESSEHAIVWDVETGNLLAKHMLSQGSDSPKALDFSGSVMVMLPYCHGHERIYFLNVATGKPIEGWIGPQVENARFATFSNDGKTILFTSPKGIRWWDPVAGKLIRQFDAPSTSFGGWVHPEAHFTPDGKVLVSYTEQMLLRWHAATGRPLFPPTQETGHTEAVRAMGVSRDGSRIATLGFEEGVRVWESKTGRQLANFPASIGNQSSLDFSPDGRFLYVPNSSRDAVVKWDLTTGKEVARYSTGVVEPWGGGIQSYQLAEDGRSVHAVTRGAAADAEKRNSYSRFVTWDVDSGRVLSQKPGRVLEGLNSDVTGFSPDGRWGTGRGLLFPVASPGSNVLAGTKMRLYPSGEFSWDSRLIAFTSLAESGESAKAIVLEVATGAKVFESPVRWVASYAFHPDGRSLVGAVSDGLVFWDLSTGKEYTRRKAHRIPRDNQSFATIVRYLPDGKRLATSHEDTTSLVWEAPTRPAIARILNEQERNSTWDDLASPDGAKGWAAVWTLADDPGSIAMFREKLKPVAAVPEKEFGQLLRDLGAEDFATRESATKCLGKAGECVVDQLYRAKKTELSAEQRDRVDRLLAKWTASDQRPPVGEKLRVLRAVASLELAGSPYARELLGELASGATAATATREAKRALVRRNANQEH